MLQVSNYNSVFYNHLLSIDKPSNKSKGIQKAPRMISKVPFKLMVKDQFQHPFSDQNLLLKEDAVIAAELMDLDC
jgi:hypothetical protein